MKKKKTESTRQTIKSPFFKPSLPLIDVEKGDYVEGIAGHIIANVTVGMLDSLQFDILLTFIDISYLIEVFKPKNKFQTHNFSTLCSIKLVLRSI